MAHEKAAILRSNVQNILRKDQHCLHVLYMQTDRVEMVVPRHQAQGVTQSLINVGHSVVSDYSIAGMQVRRDGSSEDKSQRCNTYYAHRALTRTLDKGNLGRSVTLFYKNKRVEIEAAFPDVFKVKGKE